jgi:hypothetical protein
LKGVGCTPPTDEMQSIKFKDALCPKRFTTFQAEWANARARKDPSHLLHLLSVSAMAEYASAFVDFKGRTVDAVHASAFVASATNHKPRFKMKHNKTKDSDKEKDRPIAVADAAITTKVRYPCALCGDTTHSAYKCSKLDAAKRAISTSVNVAHNIVGNATERFVVNDSGATKSLFGDKTLLINLRKAQPVTFCGISGSVVSDIIGYFLGTMPVNFSEGASVNLLSLNELRNCKGVNTTYDHDTNAFNLTVHDKAFCFGENDGLYASVFLSTTELESNHTAKDVVAAKNAREFARRLGVPAQAALRQMLVHNSRSKLDFEPRHVTLAENLYGRRVAELAGKQTEPRNIVVKHNLSFTKGLRK